MRITRWSQGLPGYDSKLCLVVTIRCGETFCGTRIPTLLLRPIIALNFLVNNLRQKTLEVVGFGGTPKISTYSQARRNSNKTDRQHTQCVWYEPLSISVSLKASFFSGVFSTSSSSESHLRFKQLMPSEKRPYRHQ